VVCVTLLTTNMHSVMHTMSDDYIACTVKQQYAMTRGISPDTMQHLLTSCITIINVTDTSMYVCTKFEADISIRSKVVRAPKI